VVRFVATDLKDRKEEVLFVVVLLFWEILTRPAGGVLRARTFLGGKLVSVIEAQKTIGVRIQVSTGWGI